jgi:hypothetical protein
MPTHRTHLFRYEVRKKKKNRNSEAARSCVHERLFFSSSFECVLVVGTIPLNFKCVPFLSRRA